MKKIISLLLCALLMVPLSIPVYAKETETLSQSLSCKSAILMEVSSGQVLIEKNADEKDTILIGVKQDVVIQVIIGNMMEKDRNKNL